MKILILANNDVGLYNFRKELIEKLIELKNDIYISLPYGERVEDLKKFMPTDLVKMINAVLDKFMKEL